MRGQVQGCSTSATVESSLLIRLLVRMYVAPRCASFPLQRHRLLVALPLFREEFAEIDLLEENVEVVEAHEERAIVRVGVAKLSVNFNWKRTPQLMARAPLT